ncbi:hypothetical protein C8R46DRAFT_1224248 [Mycena filopes]|nr:hypothetical protein C8R46DRAFT_1224248 [Mycena filopes]
MSPSPSPTTQNQPAHSGQTWQSQLICLFTIMGLVLLYTLCCHVYNLLLADGAGAADSTAAVDRILATSEAAAAVKSKDANR